MGSRRRHMALASLISRQAIDAPRRPQRHWDPMLAGQRPTYALWESISWPKRPTYAFRNTCDRSGEVGWWAHQDSNLKPRDYEASTGLPRPSMSGPVLS